MEERKKAFANRVSSSESEDLHEKLDKIVEVNKMFDKFKRNETVSSGKDLQLKNMLTQLQMEKSNS